MSAVDAKVIGPHSRRRIAVASMVGTTVEFYDFYIYATAAVSVFPHLFFPKGNGTTALLASLATFGLAFVARPLGSVLFGHFGDRVGRKATLVGSLLTMGIATFVVGVLPTYQQVGIAAPVLLALMRFSQGLALGGEWSGAALLVTETAEPAKRARAAMWPQLGAPFGFLLANGLFLILIGWLGHSSVDADLGGPFLTWGWRIPFLLSVVVLIAGYIIRREVDETPAFTEERGQGDVPRAPVIDALTNHWPDMLRVICMALMNVIPVVATIFGAAYAVQPAYGVGMDKTIYLWIPVIGNIVAIIVIPFVGNLSDRIGRRTPIIVGSLAAGLMTFAYLYAISIKSVPLAFLISILMWGVVYQGYNAVFPSFYPELFPTRARVSGMAIAQNIGTMLTALLPALFATVAPPGSANVPMTVGALAFGVTAIASIACWTARETYRIHLNDLGEPGAAQVDKTEYDRLRQQSIASPA